MKKDKILYFSIIFIVLSLLFLTYIARDFISYNASPTQNAIENQQDLTLYKKQYMERLEMVSSEENYYEAERRIYLLCLTEGKNQINECGSIEEIEVAFRTNAEEIQRIKTISEHEAEELNNYKNIGVLEIKEYVNLERYRIEEKNEINRLISVFEEKIGNSSEKNEIDNFVREFKIRIYSMKTDAELYEEELQALIDASVLEIENHVKVSDYRANEAQLINSTIVSFKERIVACSEKDEVKEVVSLCKDILDSIKTAETLYNEELVSLVNECYNELLAMVDFEHMPEEGILSYREYCDKVKAEMLELHTKEAVREKLTAEKKNAYIAGAQANDPTSLRQYKEILISELTSHNDVLQYRETQKNQILSLRSNGVEAIEKANTYDETVKAFESAIESLDSVQTNDQMWRNEDAEFIETLSQTYGSYILQQSKTLTEADTVYDLAKIIDYYAFYQIDGTSFLRNKFRVKLNYEHRDATAEINAVYWHCELLRSGAGIYGEFEDADYLVLTLVPYRLATISNISSTERIQRYDSLMNYKSDSVLTDRTDDFDTFPYQRYSKQLNGIWNTQQLWYALEHEYVPNCVAESPAEQTLLAAKAILRDIIKEGMSDEEKIFRIFNWFGDNVRYDYKYTQDFYQSTLEKYPEAVTSMAFHAEGAIFDGLAVCEGYAKAYLLLLRLEGVESYRIVKSYAIAGEIISDFNGEVHYSGGYGSHAFVGIKMSDGKLYYSDTEQTFISGNEQKRFYQQFMVAPSLFVGYGGRTFLLPEIQVADCIWEGYKNFTANGTTLFVTDSTQLKSAIEAIESVIRPHCQVSIFCDLNFYPSIKEDLYSLIHIDVIEKSSSDNRNHFVEFVLYK